MTFPDYLEKKYIEWQLQEGRKTIIDFAAYIGVSQPLLSQWMSGKKRPGVNNIKMLADIFGLDVYDALGIQRPNPYLQRLNRIWEFIPAWLNNSDPSETNHALRQLLESITLHADGGIELKFR